LPAPEAPAAAEGGTGEAQPADADAGAPPADDAEAAGAVASEEPNSGTSQSRIVGQ